MTTPHEVTTRLPGGRGEPMLIVREPGWQEQAAAERDAQQRAEIKAEVERIERERVIRNFAPRPPLAPADPVERIHAEHKREEWLRDCAESRDLPRKQAELEAWAARVELQRAAEPPQPGAAGAERARDNEYSFGLQQWKASVTACGHGSCIGRCVYQ